MIPVKEPLERELLKYSPDKCSLTATIMHEKPELDAEQEEHSNPTIDKKKVTMHSLPPLVLEEMKSLKRLAEKAKTREVESTLFEWEDDGVIDAAERVASS